MTRVGCAALLLVLAACIHPQVEETEHEEFRFESVGPAEIVVRIEDGSIEIAGSDTDSIEAEFVKRARSVDSGLARTLLENVEVSAEREGERFRFVGRAQRSGRYGSVSTDLRLRIPREVELELHSGDGSIEIRGVRGRFEIDTGDGDIRAERLAGEIRMNTGDGAIGGRGLEGEVEASTSDGEIELDGSFRRLSAVTADGDIRIECLSWPEEVAQWVARTSDGSIVVTLPRSASAEIDATTSDGRIVSRLSSLEIEEEGEQRLRGTLGAGGPLLLISTMDGRIEIRER